MHGHESTHVYLNAVIGVRTRGSQKKDPRNFPGAQRLAVSTVVQLEILPHYKIKIRPELKTFSLYYHEPFEPKDTINLFITF